MKRILFLILPLLILATLWYRYRATASRDVPDAAARVAHVVPGAEFVNVNASATYYREQILRYPDVVKNYVGLAQLYMQRARTTADEAKYVPRVRDLLDEGLRREPDHYHALVLKASLLNTLHQFEEAHTLAEQLIARHPNHAYNYGTLVDALVELGAYEEAVAACDRMLGLRPDLAAYARASYLRELHGDTAGAIAAMRLAANAGVAGHESRAWALFQLGQLYLGSNKPDTAAFLFNGILEELPDYTRALGGLAHVQMVKGNYDEAIMLLEEAYADAPNAYFLELLAEAYPATGDDEKLAMTLGRIQQRFEDAAAMGEDVDMEYADFLADQDTSLEKALRLARKSYERRPDHLHTLETYAWALYKNGRAEEAISPIQRAMRLGTGDAMVHYRAGMIYHAAGQPDAAYTQFHQAMQNHLYVESRAAAENARAMLTDLTSDAR